MEGFSIVMECRGLREYYLSPCTNDVIVDAPAGNVSPKVFWTFFPAQ